MKCLYQKMALYQKTTIHAIGPNPPKILQWSNACHLILFFSFFFIIRACALYSTVDKYSNELESGLTREKRMVCQLVLIFSDINLQAFFVFHFFFPTSQKIPCRDLSTIELKRMPLFTLRDAHGADHFLTRLTEDCDQALVMVRTDVLISYRHLVSGYLLLILSVLQAPRGYL